MLQWIVMGRKINIPLGSSPEIIKPLCSIFPFLIRFFDVIGFEVLGKLRVVTFVLRNACVARPAPPVTAPVIAPYIKPSAPPSRAAISALFFLLILQQVSLSFKVHVIITVIPAEENYRLYQLISDCISLLFKVLKKLTHIMV